MDHGSHDMDMTMTMTSTDMAMPTSTGMSGHGDHSSGSSDGGMAMTGGMTMVFFTSSDTPLFSERWTPANQGQYAGTCIFLITLGLILRVLLALRPILEKRFWGPTAGVGAAAASLKKSTSEEENDEEGRLLARQQGQALAVVGRDIRRGWAGWRVGAAASRATYEMVIAGVGYLL